MAAHVEQGKAYQPKGEVFFDDGREISLLHYIYRQPNIDTIRNDPLAILELIDQYARTEKYLMNVGEDKGRIVTALIEEAAPQLMLELGGYVGYSALLFGCAIKRTALSKQLRTGVRAPPPRYYSLERNPEFAAVVMSLVDLAGLRDVVTVVVGPSDVSIRRLHAEGLLQGGIDLMFLDHYKPAYTTDLKLCEELGLIRPPTSAQQGTVLAADNVISPGNPPYLEYVRASPAQKKQALESQADSANEVDKRFKDRTAKQYLTREGEETLSQTVRGNPRLIYNSELVPSFEPVGIEDGVEITRCIGEEPQ